MKRALLAFGFCYLVSGCVKDTSCDPKSVDSERTTIVNYAAANSISATAHTSGLYYEITNPGAGASPTSTSGVKVTYTGKLLNGSTFDSATTPVDLPLGQAIQGWQIGLPLLKEGGSMKMIIPSSLAWGCQGAGSGVIPPDAIVYFEVTLVDVL